MRQRLEGKRCRMIRIYGRTQVSSLDPVVFSFSSGPVLTHNRTNDSFLAVSPPNRLARKLPPRSSFSSTLRPNFSPLTPPTSLPGQEETPVIHRKTSPDQSTDEYTDNSSPRSISVDPDSGGDSGVGGTNIVSNNMAARKRAVVIAIKLKRMVMKPSCLMLRR